MARNADMVLAFDPRSELHFPGPYNKPSMTLLKVANLTNRLMAFKVKTTAPKLYSVIPTHGFVAAHGDIVIYITLSVPENQLDSFIAKSRHKFLIQATYGPETENGAVPLTLTAELFWKEYRGMPPFEQKLKCTFDKDTESPAPDAGPSQTREPRLPSLSQMPYFNPNQFIEANNAGLYLAYAAIGVVLLMAYLMATSRSNYSENYNRRRM